MLSPESVDKYEEKRHKRLDYQAFLENGQSLATAGACPPWKAIWMPFVRKSQRMAAVKENIVQ